MSVFRRDDEIVLGPVSLPDGVLSMHTPRASDAAAWSQARLANRAWLERAFPAWGDDWEAEQSPTVWVQRARLLRRARASGCAPFVMRLDGRLVGEVGIDAIDRETLTGEASTWAVRSHGAQAMNVASLLVMQYALERDQPLARILGPASVAAREGRRGNFTALGFTLGPAVPRTVGDQVIFHDLWVLENTADSRARVAGALAQIPVADRVEVLDRVSVVRVLRWQARALVRRTRDRVRRIRLSRRPVPTPASLPATSDRAEVRLTPVERGTRGSLRWVGSAVRRADPGLTVRITLGGEPVTTAAFRYDAGTGALRASIVGQLDETAIVTLLEAMEAASAAWWPKAVALEWKHPAASASLVELVESQGYLAALDEQTTTLWVRPRVEQASLEQD